MGVWYRAVNLISRRFHRRTPWQRGYVWMSLGAIVSKILGVLREMVMAFIFGTSVSMDTWLMATAIPNLLFGAVEPILSKILIPVLSERHRQMTHEDFQEFVGQLYGALTAFSLVLVLVGEWQTPVLVHLLAFGFSAQKINATILLARIMMPTMYFWAMAGLINGLFQARGVFSTFPVSILILNSVRLMTVIVLGWIWGIVGVAVGFVVGVASQLLYLVPTLQRQTHVHLRMRYQWNHPEFRRAVRLAGPTVLASVGGAAGLIVDRMLASTLPTGNIAALNYSYLILQLPLSILIIPLVTPVFAQLSGYWNTERRDLYAETLSQSIGQILVLAVPVTLSLVCYRHAIVSAFFQHGAFTHHSTKMTAQDLLAWALGVPGLALGDLLSRQLFAQQIAGFVARVSVLTLVINIMGDVAFIRWWGGAGLALATVSAAWIRTVVLGWKVRPYIRIAEHRLMVFSAAWTVYFLASAGGADLVTRWSHPHGVFWLLSLATLQGSAIALYVMVLRYLHPRHGTSDQLP